MTQRPVLRLPSRASRGFAMTGDWLAWLFVLLLWPAVWLVVLARITTAQYVVVIASGAWTPGASADDAYALAQQLATGDATDSPTAGPASLTINGESLGAYDYHIVDGPLTVSAFSSDDYFTTTEDSRAAFVVVKGDLTINSGQVFRPSKRKLFTVVYVTGDCAIAGEISMSQRGANHSVATGSAITAAAIRIATGTFGGVANPQVPAAGGAGGPSGGGGDPGSAGSGGGCGGGGAGGDLNGNDTSGSAGTAFSGGCGGGGSRDTDTDPIDPIAGIDGGAGGPGAPLSGNACGGGAGNPGGTGSGPDATDGGDGTGGVLVLIVAGELSGTGNITAAGAAGGDGPGVSGAGGGGSGGGSVTVLYGTDASSITPAATGGSAGSGGSRNGGAGGAGTARKLALA